MGILVAYASHYGWTQGIAERIAETLQEAGLEAAARPVADVHGLEDCEALVIGSGVYLGRWLKEAKEFVQLNQGLLKGPTRVDVQ